MKGLDFHFSRMLADYLDEPEEPEPDPCSYCEHDLDTDDECHNPECPNE